LLQQHHVNAVGGVALPRERRELSRGLDAREPRAADDRRAARVQH
jgi:hypothetical protein